MTCIEPYHEYDLNCMPFGCSCAGFNMFSDLFSCISHHFVLSTYCSISVPQFLQNMPESPNMGHPCYHFSNQYEREWTSTLTFTLSEPLVCHCILIYEEMKLSHINGFVPQAILIICFNLHVSTIITTINSRYRYICVEQNITSICTVLFSYHI